MSENRLPSHQRHRENRPQQDEGGLRAPPGLSFWGKAWWWFDFVILVKLARLRFIAVLVVIGAVITQWDLLAAYYDKWTRPFAGAQAKGGDSEWFCPMHPSVVRDNPKDKCPICFMPLSKRKKGETTTEVLPAGVVSRVQLSPYRVLLAGIRTSKVEYQALTKEITTVGYVEFDERGLKTVSARVKGRIDELFVNETGRMVDAGDQLASLYSPELLVTVENLLDAKRRGSAEMQKSVRVRLQLLGIDEPQIDEILRTGKANTHLIIRSPIDGHVIKKYVREGQYVEEGMALYEVADLSTVWVQAQVYEDDLEFLPELAGSHTSRMKSLVEQAGLPVTVVARSSASEPLYGRLTFVYPHVDQETRTVTVRVELANPGHRLRPGTTASVTIKIPVKELRAFAGDASDPVKEEMLQHGMVLAVPETSVIDTGDEKIVYREASPGVYEGVKVELGPRMSGPEGIRFYPVLAGLVEGEQVATAGSFLVDAETRLNPAAGSIYFGGSGGSGNAKGGSTVTSVRPSTPDDEDAKLQVMLAKLPEADRRLAEAQQFCPVLKESRLGSMGVPIKVMVEGEPVFVCCSACVDSATEHARETLATVKKSKQGRTATAKANAGSSSGASVNGNDSADKVRAALAKLSPADRQLAEAQRLCPVLTDSLLGSMGVPVKVLVDGQPIFVCCKGCERAALANPKETLATVKRLTKENPFPPLEPAETQSPAPPADRETPVVKPRGPDAKIKAALAKLSDADRSLAEAQRFCPVLEKSLLGSMGTPVKVMIQGTPVFLCCKACEEEALADPKATLDKVAKLKEATKSSSKN